MKKAEMLHTNWLCFGAVWACVNISSLARRYFSL